MEDLHKESISYENIGNVYIDANVLYEYLLINGLTFPNKDISKETLNPKVNYTKLNSLLDDLIKAKKIRISTITWLEVISRFRKDIDFINELIGKIRYLCERNNGNIFNTIVEPNFSMSEREISFITRSLVYPDLVKDIVNKKIESDMYPVSWTS